MENNFKISKEAIAILAIFVLAIMSFYFWRIKNPVVFPSVQIKVVIPEGYNVRQIARRFAGFRNFNKENFLKLAEPKEGFLFPDTYFLGGYEDENKIIQIMEKNFEKKIAGIQDKISASGKSLKEIIIMASILEEEAKTTEDRKIISGLLWKRIKAGMPMQVDASLAYVNGKTSAEMTLDDLKKDSPYNTYTRKGLPVGPISNPGMDSITSAMEPVDSPYWFYLSDKNGIIHLTKTFEEHIISQQKYLR